VSSRGPTLCFLLLIAVLGVACSSSADGGGTSATPEAAGGALNAEVASSDLVAGDPQRFLLGVFASDGRLLSFGEVVLNFSYLGTQEQPAAPEAGPSATASFLPTPGTPDEAGSSTTLTPPSQGRGVYQAEGVTFDRAGIWQVDLTAEVASEGTRTASATFEVVEEPALPYPGQRALRTENLTIGAKDAPDGAIDSSAANGDPVPDPQLHEWTIAEAMAQRLPVLVTFATPVYCTSRFCGPTVDEIAALDRTYRDRAVFIHVEIWRDFQGRVINQAAADWLYRDDTLTEPWTYLIGSNGRIIDRWGALFDPGEVSAELSKLPKVRIPPDG
jgi:hypothetical protein